MKTPPAPRRMLNLLRMRQILRNGPPFANMTVDSAELKPKSWPQRRYRNCRLSLIDGLGHRPNGALMDFTAIPSPAAQRMRLHRKRQKAGLRCLNVELRETEI